MLSSPFGWLYNLLDSYSMISKTFREAAHSFSLEAKKSIAFPEPMFPEDLWSILNCKSSCFRVSAPSRIVKGEDEFRIVIIRRKLDYFDIQFYVSSIGSVSS